jgi:hypothetical protein
VRITVGILAAFLLVACGSTSALAAPTSPSAQEYRAFLNPICKRDEAQIVGLALQAQKEARSRDFVKYWTTLRNMVGVVDLMTRTIRSTETPAALEAKMRPANTLLDGISVRIADFGSPGTSVARGAADVTAIGMLLVRMSPIMRSVGLTSCT